MWGWAGWGGGGWGGGGGGGYVSSLLHLLLEVFLFLYLKETRKEKNNLKHNGVWVFEMFLFSGTTLTFE